MADVELHPRLSCPSRCRGPSGSDRRSASAARPRSRCRRATSASRRGPPATSAAGVSTKPLKLPRGWMPWPPQLAQVSSGVVTRERSAERERCHSSSSGCCFSSSKASTRFLASSSSESVTGPATDSPVFGFFFARSPQPVLDVRHLVLRPALLELAQDAAVVAGVAVAVVLPLPGDDGRQVRRMQAGHAPLVAGVVRDAEHADLAVAPGLRARPLDALVEVVDLPRASCGSMKPGDQPAPRESTRTRRSRAAPSARDRWSPSSGTCWWSPRGSRDGPRPSSPTAADSRPGTRAPWRRSP